jgi:AraC-like DNA-binding protein
MTEQEDVNGKNPTMVAPAAGSIFPANCIESLRQQNSRTVAPLLMRQVLLRRIGLPRVVNNRIGFQTAADLGYDNPAAFSTLFKRTLSVAPREYIQSIDRSWEGSSRPPTDSGL